MVNGVAISLFALVSALSLTIAFILARKKDLRFVLALTVCGLSAALIKIWLFQQAPQWRDTNPDSVRYHLNALAFAKHWSGQEVSSEVYDLRGLKSFEKSRWAADEKIPYSLVVESANWLYTAYVGLWYWLAGPCIGWVIYSNAALAAFFPAAAFGIACGLGGSRNVALAAGILSILDPSAGANASWLLKDTLVGLLAMAALWAAVTYASDRRTILLIVLLFLLGLLGSSRFVAFLALTAGMGAVVLKWVWHRNYRPAFGLALAGMGGLLLFNWFQSVPLIVPRTLAGVVAAKTITAGGKTLAAKSGEEGADAAVLRWKAEFKKNPLSALAKSVVHTLFAPYPWMAIHPGLTWRSFSELYYPGVLLWMVCLPGIFFAIVRGFSERGYVSWLVTIVFLAFLLGAYTLFQGEWSTRQRVFALPAFFAMASIGWQGIFCRYHAAQG